MNAKTLSRSAVAVAVAVALSAGYVAGHRDLPAPQVISPAQAAMMPAEAAAKTGIPDFSGLVETYGPAVVNISAKHVVKQAALRGNGGNGGKAGAGGNQLPIDPSDPFYQFYKHFFGGMPGMQGGDGGGDAQDQPSASLGSGFIVSNDGYILTNAHVVDGANVVTVKLTDKREFKAKVVGADKQSDVAVLKIDASNLPTVKIGDPRQSKVGQWVVAIGSPYGFDNTVTSGIISAKSRSLPNENYTPFIQTDVPVNPGNSGGPLFNLQGEVIGINSMIYSQTGGFQGLSFAIPINEAIKVKDDIVKTGHVSRGRLGVAVQGMNQTLANSFGMQKPQRRARQLGRSGRSGCQGRSAAGRRDPLGEWRTGQRLVGSAVAGRGSGAGQLGHRAGVARQGHQGPEGDDRFVVGCEGRVEQGRSAGAVARPSRRGGAAADAGREERRVGVARSAGAAVGRRGGKRRHPAGRRDSGGQRPAGHERRSVEADDRQRRQQHRVADPARQRADLRAGRSRLSWLITLR